MPRLNTNVLAGLKCQECGSLGPFRIVVSCWAEVHDDGIEETWDHEWQGKSPCNCVQCNFMGFVRDFEPKVRAGSGNRNGNPKGGKKK